MSCSVCKGTGELPDGHVLRDSEAYTYSRGFECVSCRGTGEAPDESAPRGVIAQTQNSTNIVTWDVAVEGRMLRVECIYIFNRGMRLFVQDLGAVK